MGYFKNDIYKEEFIAAIAEGVKRGMGQANRDITRAKEETLASLFGPAGQSNPSICRRITGVELFRLLHQGGW